MGVLEQPASETLVHIVMTISQLRHGDTIITSHDRQSQSLADVDVSPPKAGVESHDCSMFCIEKWKHLERKVSSKATTLRMKMFLHAGTATYWLDILNLS